MDTHTKMTQPLVLSDKGFKAVKKKKKRPQSIGNSFGKKKKKGKNSPRKITAPPTPGGRSAERDPEELPKFPLEELEKKKEQREPQ